jgi:hypothetical protein
MVRVTRVKASAATARPPLTVSVGAARIEVRGGFDRALLREIVEVLGGGR